MSTNISYILSVIKRNIPKEILMRAFVPPTLINILNPSLDAAISDIIISRWVLSDTNMVSGVESIVNIQGCRIEYVDNGLIIYVGLGPTGGKVITSVLSIGYGYNALAGGSPGIVSALTSPLQTSDARFQLIGNNNTLYVEGFVAVTLTEIRCILENDKEFNNLSPRAMPFLANMCTLATKAYIYNTLTIELADGVVRNGIDYGRYKEIVDSYADANDQYVELRDTKWAKINTLSDPISRIRHIKMVVPS